jgi:hypothetical protein
VVGGGGPLQSDRQQQRDRAQVELTSCGWASTEWWQAAGAVVVVPTVAAAADARHGRESQVFPSQVGRPREPSPLNTV